MTLCTLHFPLYTLSPALYTSHSKPYTAFYTLYSTLDTAHSIYAVRSTLYTRHMTLHTLYTLYAPHSTLYTSDLTLGTWHSALHFTLRTLNFTLDTLHYILHSTLYTLHFIPHTLHLTPHTLHNTLRTPHFTLCTAHCMLYTLHYTVHIRHFTLRPYARRTLHFNTERSMEPWPSFIFMLRTHTYLSSSTWALRCVTSSRPAKGPLRCRRWTFESSPITSLYVGYDVFPFLLSATVHHNHMFSPSSPPTYIASIRWFGWSPYQHAPASGPLVHVDEKAAQLRCALCVFMPKLSAKLAFVLYPWASSNVFFIFLLVSPYMPVSWFCTNFGNRLWHVPLRCRLRSRHRISIHCAPSRWQTLLDLGAIPCAIFMFEIVWGVCQILAQAPASIVRL